jgi:hypothetical protein
VKLPANKTRIERFEAIQNIDAILQATDGLMVARGDLGVEIHIARMAVLTQGPSPENPHASHAW